MSRYEKYKPSDIDWIGDVPEHWIRSRVKSITDNLDGKRVPLNSEERFEISGDVPYYGATGIVDYVNEFIFDEELVLIGEDGAPFFEPLKDVSFIINGKAWVNNHAHVLRCFRNKVSSKFLMHWFNVVDYANIIKGSTRDKLNQKDLSSIEVFFPSFFEQLTIANYLDDQTKKIDRLIANKKAQAEKLKELRQIEINNAVTKGLNPNVEMKDSGIEWLGKIPKHWTTKRMKDVASVRGRIGFRGYTVDDIVDEGALVIGAKHINSSNQLNFDDPEYISWEKYYESPEIMVEVGDVLIVQRGSVGKFALVEKEIGPATINPSMILLRLNTRIHPQFLFWYLLGEHMFNIIKTIVSSTAVPMISQMQAGVFRIILPPKKEQIEIANYLMERTAAIDQLIKNIEAQIEKLQELRKIKIYEAVTGKICLNQDFQDARINRI